MKNHFHRDIISLVSIACGKAKADMYLRNGRIVNVLTGEILSGRGIAIGKDRIAYVGPETGMIGDGTEVIDCNNAYIIPGYVDAHCHMDYLYNPSAFTRHVLTMRTTTLLSELTEFGALSEKGLDYLLEATEDLPVKCFFSLPSTIPPFPEIEGSDFFDLSVMEKYKDNPRILALGEITSWPRITSLDQKIIDKMDFANEQGLLIEGHLTGCKTYEINALAAAGTTSCHESISADEAKEKLELGLYVMLRHGSVRSDMEELSRLITDNPHMNTSRIILNLDWMSPEDMAEHGYMNYLVKSAIECGVDPIRAIQAVTINPATYLGLDRDVGSVAPGRKADIQIVKNLEDGVPEKVIANGRLTAQEGRLLSDVNFPEPSFDGLRLKDWPSRKYTDRDFCIFAHDRTAATINFPVINIVNKAVTKRMDIEIDIQDGMVRPEREAGVMKLSVVCPDGSVTKGLVHGFGDRIGGLATSLGVYNNKIVILGNSDHDMAAATNRMLDLGGGIVLVKDGKIISEVPLPIAGIQSREDVMTLAGQMKRVRRDMKELGCFLEDPFYTIHFLTMSGLPYLRILPGGILDVVNKEILFPLS
ncbi:MAG: adenine deaminase [Deltaproteobacteria bacterium]|nr:adenine deaminase [Deltaproteobacteria bacterium]